MNISLPRQLVVCIAVLLVPLCAHVMADTPATGQYQVTKTIPIGLSGKWDYATLDAQGQNLYVTRGKHTIVVDTASGKVVADIPGGKGLHGVALVPDVGHGFITDGKGAAVIVFDLKTNAVLGTISGADDADGIIYDPATAHVFVSCGDSSELLPIAANVDPTSGQPDAAIDLGGKPEFLASDAQGKIFVCIADMNQIAVVDAKAMKVIAKYSTLPGETPTGLSIDRDKGRLFIGCRNQKLIVMDAKDGSIVSDLPIGKGVDATAFHAGDALASCADGTLTVARETSPGKFEVAQTLDTAPGARTMAVDSQTGTIYLPTADMIATTNPDGTMGKPKAVPGTFKIIVVSESAK
ncbi:MAG: YncE family protein [Tepidisphaeraceae bacterium]|jgi:DNA-binding beta-propeller fold protein YncE